MSKILTIPMVFYLLPFQSSVHIRFLIQLKDIRKFCVIGKINYGNRVVTWVYQKIQKVIGGDATSMKWNLTTINVTRYYNVYL